MLWKEAFAVVAATVTTAIPLAHSGHTVADAELDSQPRPHSLPQARRPILPEPLPTFT